MPNQQFSSVCPRVHPYQLGRTPRTYTRRHGVARSQSSVQTTVGRSWHTIRGHTDRSMRPTAGHSAAPHRTTPHHTTPRPLTSSGRSSGMPWHTHSLTEVHTDLGNLPGGGVWEEAWREAWGGAGVWELANHAVRRHHAFRRPHPTAVCPHVLPARFTVCASLPPHTLHVTTLHQVTPWTLHSHVSGMKMPPARFPPQQAACLRTSLLPPSVLLLTWCRSWSTFTNQPPSCPRALELPLLHPAPARAPSPLPHTAPTHAPAPLPRAHPP